MGAGFACKLATTSKEQERVVTLKKATKPQAKPPQVERRGRMVIIDADPGEIRRALRLLRRQETKADEGRTAMALKFYTMAERFFSSGGRFKRPYKRRLKTAPRKKAPKKK